MPRFPAVAKTIHGQEINQTIFLQTVCEAVASCEGGAGVSDLLPVVGPEWDTILQRRLLNNTLVNLSRRGVLKPVEGQRGKYATTTHYRRAGVNNFDEVEKTILKVIREQGGFCRWRDLLESLDVRPAGTAEERADAVNSYLYQRVKDVIRKSHTIRQDIRDRDIGRGIYMLPWAELKQMPLLGTWAVPYLKYTLTEIRRAAGRPEPTTDEFYEFRDGYFLRVGKAFKALRQLAGLTPEEVVLLKPVGAALAEFRRVGQDVVAQCRQDWTDQLSLRITAIRNEVMTNPDDHRRDFEKRATADRLVEAHRAAEEELFENRITVWLYKRFESGNVRAHCTMPLSFYVGVAEAFNVCAASLSRGVIMLQPDEHEQTRFTINDRRSTDEQIRDEMHNEDEEARMQKLLYGDEAE